MTIGQHRGVVAASNGIAAASQPLAVSAGLQALQQGGSFADAAVAISSVLCVTEPYASHLGGDAFAIIFDGAQGQTTALNGSGAAPGAALPERFAEGIPLRGLAAASTPGLVDAWFALHARWGKLPMRALLAPAIAYAREGFPAGYRYARVFQNFSGVFQQIPDLLPTLTGRDTPPQPGDMIRQPDLAWTLSQIAEGGRDAFYAGPVSERILRYSAQNGGLFAAADFESHRTQFLPPLQTSYRGFTVHGQPPVSQGHILLQMLNIIEGFDLSALGQNSADAIHIQVEAKRLAFSDRAAYLGDPDFVQVPMEWLLSKSYAAQRRALIDLRRSQPHVTHGTTDHDTTYFCVADANGSAVSFIQSVFWGFGSGAIAAGTGVLFNNRMTGFSLDPSSPNRLAPGKRTAHTLNAYLVTRNTSDPTRAALAFAGGTPGGDIQVQSNLQVICNCIDFALNPQEAIEAPRWQHGGSVGAPDEAGADTLGMEDRISLSTREELEQRGHRITPIGPWGHGSAYQLIAVHPETGAYLAGSDPRCDGHAAGF